MRWVIGLIAAFVATSASAGDDPKPGLLLVPPSEIAAVEARVMAGLAAYQERRCPRQVLRGQPEPGSGTDAVRDLGEGRGEHGRCLAFIEANKEALAPEDFDAFLASGAGVDAALLGSLDEACGGVAAAVGAAVAHGDVCSPWRPGVRGNPSFLPLMRTAKIQVILARTGYRPEDALAHARAALDRIRFDQDTVRGGGTLIAAMVSVASVVSYQGPWLRWILERGDLDAAGYGEVADALGILVATEPPIGGIIEADGYWGFLQLILPLVHGLGWVPPGGWDDGHPPVADAAEGIFGARTLFDERTDAALLAVAMDQIQRAQAEACPRDAPALACAEGLRRHAEEMIRRNELSTARRIIRVLGSPEPRREVIGWITDILMGIGTPAFDKYVEKYALRSLRLTTLRLHAAVLREWAGTGVCREDFGEAPWAALAADPVFGGPLGLSRDPDTGEQVIRPGGAFRTESINEQVEYRYRCP